LITHRRGTYIRRNKADRLMAKDPLFFALGEPIYASRGFQKLADIPHHDGSIADHAVSVAFHAFRIARALGFRKHIRELVRGALLHDYFFYDWRATRPKGRGLHGFTHPTEALQNAEHDFGPLTLRERDCIERHMFPLTPVPPRFFESLLVCLVDKVVATAEAAALLDQRKP